MGIYVNNQLKYVVNAASMDTWLTLAAGAYYTVVEEWDHCGGATTQAVNITVSSTPTSPSGVTVTSPAPNSTVTSPVAYRASATTTCSGGVASMGIYVNNQLEYVVDGSALNTSLALAPGQYNTVVQDWDNCGGSGKTSVPITVASAPTSAGVVVTSPANNSTVSSPVTYTASATTSCAKGVASMGIYVNNVLKYVQNGSSLSTALTLAPGSYYTVVQDWDNCGGSLKTPINITVTSGSKTLSSVSVSPNPVSLSVGGSQQLTATAHYSDGSTANVTTSATWSVANSSVATVNSSGVASGVAAGSTSITAAYSGASASTAVNVGVASGAGVSVTTWHFDNNRSGLNPNETSLTPTTVNAKSFGKLFSYLVDGYVYGEPLLVSNLSINGGTHNVVYVATENDSVYAFDADSYGSGAPLWKTGLLRSGETPVTTAPIKPVQGVTSTPVIDRSTNTIYVVSEQTSSSGGTFRLNALDITTGAQKFGGPVTLQASVPGTNGGSNGVVSLNTSCMQRAVLLLANGNVYIGFGGCATGWLLAYNAQTLAQVGVFNASPNLAGTGTYASAGGIWMGSAGPVADSAGNIYVVTGNGPWDGKTAWSDSVLKFSPSLQLEDSFTPQDYGFLGCDDEDLAAGGLMMIPGSGKVVTGGKSGKLYLLNTGSLGKEQANDAGAAQTLWYESDLSAPYPASCTNAYGTYSTDISSYEIFGTAAYYNGYAYLGITPTTSTTTAGIRQFAYNGTLTPGAYTSPSVQMNTRGTTPFISSNGSSGGVLWMIDTGLPLQSSGGGPTAATLRAYDADAFPNALYNSSTNSADVPGYGIKFTSPVVANGKVYISTGHDTVTTTNPRGEIDVYGLK